MAFLGPNDPFHFVFFNWALCLRASHHPCQAPLACWALARKVPGGSSELCLGLLVPLLLLEFCRTFCLHIGNSCLPLLEWIPSTTHSLWYISGERLLNTLGVLCPAGVADSSGLGMACGEVDGGGALAVPSSLKPASSCRASWAWQRSASHCW